MINNEKSILIILKNSLENNNQHIIKATPTEVNASI